METLSAEQEKTETRLLDISISIDAFETYSNDHALRIATIADALAKKFNLADHDRFCLRQAALVHDIGEMVMNRAYIKSPNPLNDNERVDMQRHPVIGEQEASRRGLSRSVQLFIRWHHENWNGSGYPDCLEYNQIPLAARILRVADSYSAMTDKRPFRAAISALEAKKHLVEWAGIEFDPLVIKTFLSLEGLKELKSFAKES
jgi:putative nucleotidyltransferase with HDIG domain